MKNKVIEKEFATLNGNVKKRVLSKNITATKEAFKKTASQKFLTHLSWLILGFIYSGAPLIPGGFPFGVALSAAYCFTGQNISVSLGAFLGYLFFLNKGGLAYCGAVLICAACGEMLKSLSKEQKHSFPPYISFISMAFTLGALSLSQGLSSFILAMCQCAIGACFTYFYIGYRENRLHPNSFFGRFAMCVTLILFLSRFTLFNMVSLSRVAVTIFLLIYIFYDKWQYSILSAIIMGALMDISSGIGPYFCGAYALIAAVGSMIRVKSRLNMAMLYIFIVSIIVLWSPQSSMAQPLMWECFFGSILFTMLPEATAQAMAFKMRVPEKAEPVHVKDRPQAQTYVKARLSALSCAIENISSCLTSLAEKQIKADDNISRVFSRAADKVCKACPVAQGCWDSNYMSTYGAMNDVTEALKKNGYLKGEDFPYHFSSRCLNLKKLVGNINEEYSLWQKRRMTKKKTQTREDILARQYMGINKAIGYIANNMDCGMEYYPDYEEQIEKILSFYDKSAKSSVYCTDGRMNIEIFNIEKTLLTDIPQIIDSISLSLGREFTPPEEIITKESFVLRLREKERFCVTITSAIREKQGEKVCGDNFLSFNTDDGRAVIMLSDGMGSGESASLASKNAISLISRFVKAGCSVEESVSAVLPVLAAGVEKIGFATLDLLEINLFTGGAKLLKYGASPTYVKRFHRVQRFSCSAFPPGLELASDQGTRASTFKLQEDNIVIMATDGIFDTTTAQSCEDLIKTHEKPQELVDGLMSVASQCPYKADDDMTIVVLSMSKL